MFGCGSTMNGKRCEVECFVFIYLLFFFSPVLIDLRFLRRARKGGRGRKEGGVQRGGRKGRKGAKIGRRMAAEGDEGGREKAESEIGVGTGRRRAMRASQGDEGR